MTPEEERLIAEVLSAGRRASRKTSIRKSAPRKSVRIWVRRGNVLRPIARPARAA